MSTSDLYDLIVVVIIIVFAIRGYQKGLINQIGALISMIVGALVSVQFTPVLAPYLWGNDNVKYLSAFVILIFAATLVIWGTVNVISTLITNLKLNFWNNQMGALLGVVYGSLWAMILTFILLIFAVPAPVPKVVVDENENPAALAAQTAQTEQTAQAAPNERSFIMASKTGPYLTTATLTIIEYLPQGGEDYRFYDYLREYLQRNANGIKMNNPDLPKAPFTPVAPNESIDEEKPRLPSSAPLESGT